MNNKNQNLPPGWVWVQLGEVCHIYDNLRKPINSEERLKRISGKQQNELFPYYGATGLVGYIDDYLIDGEYVLLGEDGAPFLDKTKNVAYIIKGKAWVNNHAHILSSYFDNHYLLHYLNHFEYKDFVSGTTRLKLTQASMKMIPIYLPPLSEQHRIVAKIEELFSSLDKAVERLKATREQLKIYRQAVLKWAFEGRFTHKDIKQGELPEGWVWKKLGEVCEVRNGYAFKSSDYLKQGENGIPVIRISDIENGEVDLSNCVKIEEKTEYDYFIVSKDDILMAMSGATTGKFGIYKSDKKAYQNQRVGKFDIFAKEVLYHSFLFYLLYSLKDKILNNAYGGAQPNISSAKIEGLSIPLPPLSEQQQIVSEIEKRLSVAEKVEESIRVALEKAERLRQSILKKAFEGKLVPQDPNDEPASVLLERIKAERKTPRQEVDKKK